MNHIYQQSQPLQSAMDSFYAAYAENKKNSILSFHPESLFSMAMYDFESPPVITEQPVVPPRPRAQPRFHPVDEYKDLTLREILDISDDFFLEDEPISPNVLDPTPTTDLSRMLATLQAQANVTRENKPQEVSSSLFFEQTMTAQADDSSKKRQYSDISEDEMDDCDDSERRFRPYQAGQWSEKFEELCQYRVSTGHCLVPHTYGENLPLARWVKRQRYQYKLMIEGKQSTMTEERVKQLEDIGFVWDSQGAAWAERLNELADFRKLYLHCNVPSNYSENPQLATWVKCQRRQYKLYQEGKPSNMTPMRIMELETLGFEWELRSYKKARTC